ncbi:response regulator transcription factor [Nocardioides marmorisolisilvae]|uniref:DNA-binding response regulator n=1 Tax=Nocardioides marmorisolisilvae TaxID=1542737 RepID=A0A3N0DU50_9ACTN|nr:response regulator transcription factor [Nocardioides marmorisolisilvae]RNL78923.1 DNA-binding response regulator [Nocardioides marmorisolisilvae]
MTSSSASGLRVLLVEDDPDVRETTALVLGRHGFDVRTAADGFRGEEIFAAEPFDVLVVDIAMPGLDGLSLTKRLRAESSIPILLLTARDLPGDVVTGLESGADDYVTKPFDGDVLAARLRALVRRGGSGSVELVGDVEIDRRSRSITRKGEPVLLSSTEFRLFELLLDHAGIVVSRPQALRRVWGDEDWIDERVVDTNVLRLRSKLGDGLIVTVRGFGYKLVAR